MLHDLTAGSILFILNYFLFLEKVNKKAKLIVMLASFMALVFISTVPMLAYRYL